MSGVFSANWLIDTAAAVTLLIALVLALRGPVARHFGAGIAYALWALPLARAMMPGITMTVEAPATAAPSDIITVVAGGAAPAAFDPLPWLIALWLAGAALLAGQALWATLRLRRAVLADGVLLEQRGRIRVLMSAAVNGPVAMGIIAPLVVLPPNFTERFTPVEQQQVLAHEIEHHRGHDLVITLAAFALLALNWFNPIAWAGWRAFRQDQEAACDARTLAGLGGEAGHDRATYGRAIAAAATGHAFRPATALTLAMGEKSAILHRLRSLAMTDISTRRRWAGRAALLGCALFTLPLTASVSYAVEQAEPPAPPVISPSTVSEGPSGRREYVREVETSAGRIVLRTSHELSDAEADRMVARIITRRTAEAAENSAVGVPGEVRERHVITMRINANADGDTAAPPAPPAPPVPPTPPAPPTPPQSQDNLATLGSPAYDADIAPCRSDRPHHFVTRTYGRPGAGIEMRAVVCGTPSREQEASAMRSFRAAIAEQRRLRAGEPAAVAAYDTAIEQIDAEIAAMESSPGQ